MRSTRWAALHADTPTRGFRHTDLAEAVRGLFVEGDAPAAGGGAPAAPAAAAPAAAAPAAAAPAAAPAAVPAKVDDGGSIIGGDKSADAPAAAAAAAPAKVSADDQRKYLTEKGGKAEDLAKLSEADLQKKFDEAKAKDAKPADGKPVKAEDIKLTVPEGITVDETTMTELTGILADAKLTPTERGQKLMDLHARALLEQHEAPYKLWAKTQKEWQDAIKADEEIGGANFEPMKSRIEQVIGLVGKKEAAEIRQAFRFTGAGNNPAIVRFLDRMAKSLTEGGPIIGGKPSPTGGSAAEKLYPNQGAPKLANAA